MRKTIPSVALVCTALMVACAPTQENVQAGLTADEARSIAKEAYIFNYPLVMMYRTMYVQAIDVSPNTQKRPGRNV